MDDLQKEIDRLTNKGAGDLETVKSLMIKRSEALLDAHQEFRKEVLKKCPGTPEEEIRFQWLVAQIAQLTLLNELKL